jgi:CRISPR-associated protein Csm5
MKPFLNTQTCHISTLTPVHIGSGEDYYPTNYVIDDGYLHYFGELQLLEALKADELRELAKLAEIRDGKTAIRRMQKSIHNQRAALMDCAQHTVPVSSALEELYLETVEGKKDLNQLAIQRNTYSPYNQQPYIPGSSLKGSMRTAILNACLEQNSNYAENLRAAVNDAIRHYENAADQRAAKRNIQRTLRQTGRDVPGRLLDYRHVTEDPLRLLKVGDAPYAHPDGLNGQEIRYAVNRKKTPSKKKSMAEERDLYTLLECLGAHRSHSFKAELILLSGRELARWEEKLPFATFGDLADLCNSYYFPRLCTELDVLESLNYADTGWISTLRHLTQGELRNALKHQRAFLLRIGKHSGADHNTLDEARCIEIMQKQGQPPKYLDHATTLWLAADSKDQIGAMLPFGWVLVEFGDAGLPETHAFLRRNAQAAYDRLEREQRRRAEAEHRREERAQAEAEARRKAEEDTARAQAEAARLAALSENGKRAEALLAERSEANKGKGPGSQLYSRLRSLIQEAEGWDEADRRALHAAAVEIFDWLNIRRDDGNRKKLLRGLMAP